MHLLTFLKVVQTGSVTQAARELAVGQPAVSIQIRNLEESLGLALFERKGKHLTLTAAGEIARSYAFQLFDLQKAFSEDLFKAERSKFTRLKIGILDGVPKGFVTAFAAAMLRLGPRIKIQLTEGKGKYLMNELRDHQIDAVVLNYSPESNELSGIKVKRVGSFPVAAFGHENMNEEYTASKEKIQQLLSSYPLILPTYHSRLRADLDGYFAEHNIKVNGRVEVEDTSVQKLLAAEKLGLALLPRLLDAEDFARRNRLKHLCDLVGIEENIWLMTLMQKQHAEVDELIWSFNWSSL